MGGDEFFKMGDLIGCFNNYYSYVVDTKTNEYLFNEKEDGYRVWDADEKLGRILITRVDDSFSGNKISIGLMNDKGEWEYPLTEFSSDELTTEQLDNDYNTYILMGNYVFLKYKDSCNIYSFKDKKLSKIEGWDSFSQMRWNNDKVMANVDGGVWIIDSTGKSTQIYPSKNVDISFVGDGIVIYDYGNKKYVILSGDDYKDMGFDLSEYKATRILDVTKNVIAFTAKNPDGDEYTIVMNKDGSLVTEPIIYDERNTILGFCGDYFVMSAKAGSTVINCKNGEKKMSENTIISINREMGVMVMDTDYYYLVYPDDLNTLLNPFELAAQ